MVDAAIFTAYINRRKNDLYRGLAVSPSLAVSHTLLVAL